MPSTRKSDAELLSYMRRVVAKERSALDTLEQVMDSTWVGVLHKIANCSGRIAVSGIGKSGLIARKISATLASTGTPSFFLHPSEALHGDLGMLSSEDILLVFSKSGESEEVNATILAAKRLGVHIISMACSGKPNSMAGLSNVALDLGYIQEACPFDLAPTSSTTASLVFGDALATTLMIMREFSASDFALRHPGGRLGRRLVLLVNDIMLAGDKNPVVNITASMKDFLLVLTEKEAGAVSVVNDDGIFLGLITDYDVRKLLNSGKHPLEMCIADCMNVNPTVTSPTEKAYAAFCLMNNRDKVVTVLPVVDRKGSAIGMLRFQDLVKAGL